MDSGQLGRMRPRDPESKRTDSCTIDSASCAVKPPAAAVSRSLSGIGGRKCYPNWHPKRYQSLLMFCYWNVYEMTQSDADGGEPRPAPPRPAALQLPLAAARVALPTWPHASARYTTSSRLTTSRQAARRRGRVWSARPPAPRRRASSRDER